MASLTQIVSCFQFNYSQKIYLTISFREQISACFIKMSITISAYDNLPNTYHKYIQLQKVTSSLPINFTTTEARLAPYANPPWLELQMRTMVLLKSQQRGWLPGPNTTRRPPASLTVNI